MLKPTLLWVSFFIMSKSVQKYLKDIEHAANFFQYHFIGKEVIYTTVSQSISIKFKSHHFSHLCGIKYQDGAEQFFKAILDKKLDLSKVKTKPDGTTSLKLQVLKSINLLLSEKVQITNNGSYLKLHFDKSIKTNKLILALTLNTDKNNQLYPNSLLNLKNKNQFPNGEQVINIKSIDLLNGSEIVYVGLKDI